MKGSTGADKSLDAIQMVVSALLVVNFNFRINKLGPTALRLLRLTAVDGATSKKELLKVSFCEIVWKIGVQRFECAFRRSSVTVLRSISKCCCRQHNRYVFK